jgi:hypothetical protein
MDEELADHVHLQIGFGHAPDLAVSQWLHGRARCGFGLNHKAACNFGGQLTSQIAR